MESQQTCKERPKALGDQRRRDINQRGNQETESSTESVPLQDVCQKACGRSNVRIETHFNPSVERRRILTHEEDV